jgi:UDP-glucose 4-epimerase
VIEKYLELYSNLHGLNYTILRIANPYGKYQKLTAEQGAIGVFLDRISENETITIWGDGSVVRDYIYVGDVANAFVKALTQDSPYRVFNIGTGVGISLRNLLSAMEKVTGVKPKVEYAPGRQVDVSINVLDSTRAHRYMNWHAETDCETGLRKTWSWLCGNKAGTRVPPRVMSAAG